MKRIASLIIAIALLFQTSNANIINPKIVHTNRGKAFTIKLLSNPTTGYMWEINNRGNNIVTLETHEYIPSKKNLTGSGGIEQWIFKALKRGKTNITFSYKRSWEKLKPLETVQYTILIK